MTENSKNTSARAAKKPAAAKKTAVTKQTAAAKKTAPKITLKAGTSAKPKPRSPKLAATAKATPTAPRTLPSAEDIAIRAYHLFLQRSAHGLQGSEEGDWLEAERQIALESVS